MGLSFRQTLADVIEDCEQARWSFGGEFKVLIPDNLKPVVINADPMHPTFSVCWLDDVPARGRGPTLLGSGLRMTSLRRAGCPVRARQVFPGEAFTEPRRGATLRRDQVRHGSGARVHDTTAQRPARHFALEEQHLLLTRPSRRL